MCLIAQANNANGRMSAMQPRGSNCLEIPLLCFRNEKVAEDRNACDGLEFFRIDEERVESEIVNIAEKLHQAAVFFDQIVGKHCDAEPALARPQQPENIVDGQPRL